jgi:hypothetical protein
MKHEANDTSAGLLRLLNMTRHQRLVTLAKLELLRIADEKQDRKEAKAAGLKTYTGKMCPRGHGTERRTSDGKCPVCAREATRASMRKKRGTRRVTVVHAGMQLRGNTLRQHMAAVAADVDAMSDDELRERAERRKR